MARGEVGLGKWQTDNVRNTQIKQIVRHTDGIDSSKLV
jgi:hypothetical protein